MLKIAVSAFVMIFLAEFGDKTQLAIFALATQSRSPWAVLLGAGTALILSTVLAVGLGYFVCRAVQPGWIKPVRYAAGAWTIWK